MIAWNRPSVRVTHVPTGVSAIVDSSRSNYKNEQVATKVLRSRLWAIQNGYGLKPDVISETVLPDDVEWPNDLGDYRTAIAVEDAGY